MPIDSNHSNASLFMPNEMKEKELEGVGGIPETIIDVISFFRIPGHNRSVRGYFGGFHRRKWIVIRSAISRLVEGICLWVPTLVYVLLFLSSICNRDAMDSFPDQTDSLPYVKELLELQLFYHPLSQHPFCPSGQARIAHKDRQTTLPLFRMFPG